MFPLEQTRDVGSAESQVPKLVIREIIFEEFQRLWSSAQSTNVTDERTDRQTTYHGNIALRYASHSKKHSETANIRQADILNFDERHISCRR